MKRFLLDTGIAGDYLDRRHGVFERERKEVAKGYRIGIGISVLAELAFGIELSASRERNLERLHRSLSGLTVWPFTKDAALEYGRVAGELRRIGRPMQSMDIIVASIALSLGNCNVVTTDSDLSAVPGLDVANWRA